MIPVHKKGEVTDISNSSISNVGLYERVMNSNLVNYLERNDLFYESQHRFRKGKTVVTAAVDFSESINRLK